MDERVAHHLITAGLIEPIFQQTMQLIHRVILHRYVRSSGLRRGDLVVAINPPDILDHILVVDQIGAPPRRYRLYPIRLDLN